MRKKILLVLIFALFCTVLIVGCGNKSEPLGSVEKLDIVDSALTLDCFETYTLEVETQDVESINWSSSDPSIVSVDENGLLTAGIKLGTATITASSGEYSDDCSVTVILKNGLPEMSSVKEVFISEGGKYDIPFNVYYNSINISKYLTFECNLTSETVESVATASVSGNVVTFSGVSEGDAIFTVYTTVFGRLYAEEVKISVRNTDIIYVVNGAINNQLQLRAENEHFTSDIEVYYKDKRVPDNTLEWVVSNEEIVTIGEDGKLIGNKEGIAVLSTEYQGENISVEICVIKNREYITVEQDTPLDFDLDVTITVDVSSKKRTYAVNETKNNTLQIGDESDQGTVMHAYIDEELLNADSFSFVNGAVTIPTKIFGTDLYGEKTLKIEVEDKDVVRIYTFKVLLITKIPHTLLEFKNAIVTQWQGDRILGYFVLDSDIDFNSYILGVYATDWNWDNGFKGTLDGRNHSLNNVCSGFYGISAQMGEGAVLKNLKIPNFKYDGGETTLFARGAAGVTFENIEITLTEDSSCAFSSVQNSYGVLISYDMRRCVFKNIRINAVGKDLQRIFGGTNQEKGSSCYENVYIYAASVTYYENDTTVIPDGVSLITND